MGARLQLQAARRAQRARPQQGRSLATLSRRRSRGEYSEYSFGPPAVSLPPSSPLLLLLLQSLSTAGAGGQAAALPPARAGGGARRRRADGGRPRAARGLGALCGCYRARQVGPQGLLFVFLSLPLSSSSSSLFSSFHFLLWAQYGAEQGPNFMLHFTAPCCACVLRVHAARAGLQGGSARRGGLGLASHPSTTPFEEQMWKKAPCKNALQEDVPSVAAGVEKLGHMGKVTVRKLADLGVTKGGAGG